MTDVPALTTETVAEFLNERKAGNPCPFCSTQGWTLSEGSSTAAGLVSDSVVELDGTTPAGRIQSYLLVCKNCGFLRPILRQTLDSWLRAKEEMIRS